MARDEDERSGCQLSSEAEVRSEGTEGRTPASGAATSPPYSNRGVYPLAAAVESSEAGANFDAYCATVYDEPIWLIDELMHELSEAGEKPTCGYGPPVRFYGENALLLDQFGKRLCSIRWGGSNGYPFVECKGAASPVVVALLRREFDHRPARIDHALDRRAPGLFNELEAATVALARKYRLKWVPDGDWVTQDAGRTIYLGSRSSQVLIRIYEKGLKYARELGLEVTPELREWVRIELEFKPQTKQARALASAITPEQMWGATKWSAELAHATLSIATERVSIRERRESDRDRALRFMTSQYRTHLSFLLAECADDLYLFGLHIAELAKIGVEDALVSD